MKRRIVLTSAVVLLAMRAAAGAQQSATIDPGMTRPQVVAKLGEPLSSRSFESFVYLLYRNGCEKTCGMNDLVVLDSGKVVDAIFRAPSRHYSGTSSSPRAISADAARTRPDAAPTALDTARKPHPPAIAPAPPPAPNSAPPKKPAN
jgi:hypothetical protein